jgi:hypothetical protein
MFLQAKNFFTPLPCMNDHLLIRLHERTILLRFLGIILRVYITNQFQATFAQGGGGGEKSVSTGDCE